MDDPNTKAWLVLILNILFPGVGGLIYQSGITDDPDKKKKIMTTAIIQLVGWIVGIVTSWLCVGFFLWAAALIWALIDGIKFFKEIKAQAPAAPAA